MTIEFSWNWLGITALVLDFIIRVIAVIVVPRNRRPTAGMAWLLAIFLIPYIGVLAFLLIGNPKLPRKRRKKQYDINVYIARRRETSSRRISRRTLRPGSVRS